MGNRWFDVVLPRLDDARLHTAAVIISIHIVGVAALGFRVSVPQILAAILAAAAVDVFVDWRRTGQLVWPASGMLTGSGVALILRQVGMDRADYWSWSGWYLFALVAGVSVLSKHLIRLRGSHVFNPSNLGLVVGFLLLGSKTIEPLDFWWAPIGPWMGLAYAIIVIGGVVITRRLQLLEMAVGFWLVFASSLGVLAFSGHCMTAAWSVDPVCGAEFWSILVTSPEVLVFLFFMITDPKTVPAGRVARLAFAGSLAVAATLLVAPQTAEYGAKVALLGSLVLWSPLRSLFARIDADRTLDTEPVAAVARYPLTTGPKPVSAFGKGAAAGSLLVLSTLAIVLVGSPARDGRVVSGPQPEPAKVIEIDESSIPPVAVSDEVLVLNAGFDSDAARDLAVTLVENLEIENKAMLEGNGSYLSASSAGDRLADMQRRLDAALASGIRTQTRYRLDTLALGVEKAGEGQTSAALSLHATGTVETVMHDAWGREQSRSIDTVDVTFVMRKVVGERWQIVAVHDLRQTVGSPTFARHE